MGRRERLLLVVAALVAALVIGFGFGRSTASFHWTATGTLTYHARCSKEGHAQVPDTCAFQVPNPPTLAKKITLDVRVHNTSAVRHCYGLSVTTSYRHARPLREYEQRQRTTRADQDHESISVSRYVQPSEELTELASDDHRVEVEARQIVAEHDQTSER